MKKQDNLSCITAAFYKIEINLTSLLVNTIVIHIVWYTTDVSKLFQVTNL